MWSNCHAQSFAFSSLTAGTLCRADAQTTPKNISELLAKHAVDIQPADVASSLRLRVWK